MENEVLCTLSRKLGINNGKVLKRAAELSRLAEVRCAGAVGSLGLSGSAKSVICVEIAAGSCGVPVDKVGCACVKPWPNGLASPRKSSQVGWPNETQVERKSKT